MVSEGLVLRDQSLGARHCNVDETSASARLQTSGNDGVGAWRAPMCCRPIVSDLVFGSMGVYIHFLPFFSNFFCIYMCM